ncbi:MAG: helix-turn-helix domain-containing protein [Actinomycetota bacterium]|nr:helix-turn-helix domain-containing protein [Actinomycetota bacterium]
MTEDEVHALPVVVDLPTAARVLGLGRNTAYELVRSGAWPTPLLRFGRLIKVPRSSLLDLLGIPTAVERAPEAEARFEAQPGGPVALNGGERQPASPRIAP